MCVRTCERPVERAVWFSQTAQQGTLWGRPQHNPLPPLLCSCTRVDIRTAQISSQLLQCLSLPPPLLLGNGAGNAPTPRPRSALLGSAGRNAWERPCPMLSCAVAQTHGQKSSKHQISVCLVRGIGSLLKLGYFLVKGAVHKYNLWFWVWVWKVGSNL